MIGEDRHHVHERPAEREGDREDRQPDQPEPVIAQRLPQCDAGQRGPSGGVGLRPFFGRRFAEERDPQRQRDQQREGGDDDEHHAPSVIGDGPLRDLRDDDRRDAGTHQQDPQCQPLAFEEPHVHRAAPGDRR